MEYRPSMASRREAQVRALDYSAAVLTKTGPEINEFVVPKSVSEVALARRIEELEEHIRKLESLLLGPRVVQIKLPGKDGRTTPEQRAALDIRMAKARAARGRKQR